MSLIAIIQVYPTISIILAAILISFFTSLVQHFVLDKERMRELKAKQKSMQDEMKNHKDNPQKMMELQKEMLSHSMETMKHSFKPMLITTIPILLFFSFIRTTFAATSISKSWFWFYLTAAIISSLIFRKLFKLP